LHTQALGLSRGHFYFALRGHYHFAATQRRIAIRLSVRHNHRVERIARPGFERGGFRDIGERTGVRLAPHSGGGESIIFAAGVLVSASAAGASARAYFVSVELPNAGDSASVGCPPG
jgi:hypothetical protein